MKIKQALFSILLLVILPFELFSSDKINTPTFSLFYLHDVQENFSIDDVVDLSFNPIPPQISLGNYRDTTWYKIVISSSSQIKHLQLHDNRAYLSQNIEIFEVLDNKIIVKKSYDLFDKKGVEELSGSSLVYSFSIPSETSKTIFIKKKALIHQLIDLELYDTKSSIQALINKNYYSNIIISFLAVLALYNVMLFIYSKRKEFLFYSFYLLNASIGLSYMYGSVFHNFNGYGEQVYWLNITAILVSLLLSLFVQTVFETRKKSKSVHLLFNITIVIALLDLAIAIFVDLPFALDVVGIVFITSFVSICYLTIHFFKKKHPLIKTFIFAYFFYIVGMFITLSSLMGYISYNAFTFHASGLGLVFEAILFSYLLNFRMNLLENEISRLVKAQDALIFRADYDGLTKVLNRRAFLERAESAFSLAKRHNEPLSLIMIDLDLFKQVNDNYGHQTGDAVLFAFAKIVSNLIRNEDVFGRIGGEEFSLIFPKLTQEKALLASKKIRKAIADELITTEQVTVKQTISIGLSSMRARDKTHGDVQKRADEALYIAKASGRNQVVFQ